MRAVVQRVSSASVRVDGSQVGAVDGGLLVLVGVAEHDTEQEAVWMARKISRLRIFRDDDGRMNRSVVDIGGSVLVVSQFTLYGDAAKGNRPSFAGAASGDHASALYEHVADELRTMGVPVETGVFGAMMDVELVNDGPVTILLERTPHLRGD